MAKADERRFGALGRCARLVELLGEEVLGGGVGGELRLLHRADVGLDVRRGEERRQQGSGAVKRTSMRSVPRTSLHREVAHVAVEQCRIDRAVVGRRARRASACASSGESARVQEGRQRRAASPRAPPPPSPGSEKDGILGQVEGADGALRDVAAAQRLDLRGEEARGAVEDALGLVEIEDVVLELQLDRRRARHLDLRRGAVGARGQQGDRARRATQAAKQRGGRAGGACRGRAGGRAAAAAVPRETRPRGSRAERPHRRRRVRFGRAEMVRGRVGVCHGRPLSSPQNATTLAPTRKTLEKNCQIPHGTRRGPDAGR